MSEPRAPQVLVLPARLLRTVLDRFWPKQGERRAPDGEPAVIVVMPDQAAPREPREPREPGEPAATGGAANHERLRDAEERLAHLDWRVRMLEAQRGVLAHK